MAVVYVDPSIGSGGDGTSPATAKKTWASVTWTAGNTYLQAKGTRATEKVTVGASSVYLGAYGSGAMPIIDGTGQSQCILIGSGRSNITVEGLMLLNSNSAAIQLSPDGTDNTVRGCYLADFLSYGAFTRGQVRLTFTGNRIRSRNRGGFATGFWADQSSSQDGIVSDNWIHDINGDALIFKAGVQRFTVERNVIGGEFKDGIALEDTDGFTVRYNTVMHRQRHGDSYPCLKLGNNFDSGTGTRNAVITDNIFASFGPSGALVRNYKALSSNTMDRNRYFLLRGGSDASVIFGWNTSLDTIASNNYTFAAMQAAGKYEQSGQRLSSLPGYTGFVGARCRLDTLMSSVRTA